VAGPAWLASVLAAVMIMIAIYCASRLAISRLRRRETEFDADGLHVVMGVAMAGMFVPRLSLLPARAWEAIFAIAAAWFSWQAIRGRRGNASADWRSPHPLPHLVECVAMFYMLVAVSSSRPAGSAAGMSMPGMGRSPGAWNLPALAVVLALFMVGYVVWSADQLTSLTRRQAAAVTESAPGGAGSRHGDSAGRPILSPRLAACYKIAMSGTMGYMLVLML
jgi:Domain of unknown function (DUF5134)